MGKYYSTDGTEWNTEKEAIKENKKIQAVNYKKIRQERLNAKLSELANDSLWQWNFSKKRYKDNELYIATQLGKHGNYTYTFKGTNGLREILWEYFISQMNPDYGYFYYQDEVEILKSWLKNEEKDLCAGYVLKRAEQGYEYEEWDFEKMGKIYE